MHEREGQLIKTEHSERIEERMKMELYLFFFIIIFFLLPLFVIFKSSRRPIQPEAGVAKSYSIIRSLSGLIRNRHRYLDWIVENMVRYSTQTLVFQRLGKLRLVTTANPANVEYILKTKFSDFPKGERMNTVYEDFLGRGIFNSDGEMWWKQRKTASYEFSTKSLRDFVLNNVTVELTSRLIPTLTEAASSGKILDLQDILERFAFDNICKLAFNFDPACLDGDATAGGEFMRAFETATSGLLQRFQSISPYSWKIKRKLNIGSEKLLKESISTVRKFADEIVRTRMERIRTGNDEDLLSRFINHEEMNSHELLRDIVISFILAGRDTTSSGLSWFFWLLSLNPKVEEKILKKLDSIRAKTGKKIGESYGFEDLKQMIYLHAAITESLRLYPPVPFDAMSCMEDNLLPDGTFVKKGWGITYSAFGMGRMESVWGKDCELFKPERWIDEKGGFRAESPFKFPVFHAGPRTCLGKEMAYIQMKSIVATVIERFVIDVPGKEKRPEILLSGTLRMRGGLLVKVQERRIG